jgi:hypothetical protein
VIHTPQPAIAKQHVIAAGWLSENKVEIRMDQGCRFGVVCGVPGGE